MGETTLHQAGGKNGSRFIHHERFMARDREPFWLLGKEKAHRFNAHPTRQRRVRNCAGEIRI